MRGMWLCWVSDHFRDIKKRGRQRHEDEVLSGDGREEVIRYVWIIQRMGKEGSMPVVLDVTRSIKRMSDLFMEVEMCVHGVKREGIHLGKEKSKCENLQTGRGSNQVRE